MPILPRLRSLGTVAQVAIVLVLLLQPVAAQTQSQPTILGNPSFEASSTDFEPWACVAGTCGLDGQGAGHFAADGSQYAFLFPSSVLTQKTNAVAGATYYLTVSAYLVNGPPTGANLQITFGRNTAPAYNIRNPVSSYVTVPNGTVTGGPYAAFGMNLTAQGNDNLTFAFFGAPPSVDASGQNLTTAIRLDAMNLVMVAPPPSGFHAPGAATGLTGREIGLIVTVAALVLCSIGGWAMAWRMNKRRRRTEGVIPIPLPHSANNVYGGLEEKLAGAQNSVQKMSYDGTGYRPQTTSTSGHSHYSRPTTAGEVMVVSPSRNQSNTPWDPYARDRYSVFRAQGQG